MHSMGGPLTIVLWRPPASFGLLLGRRGAPRHMEGPPVGLALMGKGWGPLMAAGVTVHLNAGSRLGFRKGGPWKGSAWGQGGGQLAN